jgi:antitoxin component of MazEF toxin-antitoxin module
MLDDCAEKESALREEVPAASKASATAQYTLEELLAQCCTNAPPSEEDRAWIDSPSFGKELL